ncbi:hypothetical protein H0W26_00435 [Candidatus Dependentiae bacterium]|nr:hypothetical protein [Candidatus Dependentiae bacterium]
MNAKKNSVVLSSLLLVLLWNSLSNACPTHYYSGSSITSNSPEREGVGVTPSNNCPEVSFKALALRAEGLIKALQYDEALPLVLILLKEEQGKHLSQHTAIPLDEALGLGIAFNYVHINQAQAKKEFKKLFITKQPSLYILAQANAWLGSLWFWNALLLYLENKNSGSFTKAKKYFEKVVALNSNKRATAHAKLLLGIAGLFEKGSFKKLFFSTKDSKRSCLKQRTYAVALLTQAKNQQDALVVAAYAKRALETAPVIPLGLAEKDRHKAHLDFRSRITGA